MVEKKKQKERKKNMLFLSTLFNLILAVFYSLFSTTIYAQTFSLSLYPPILEAVIKPGEKIEQTYIIENSGGDTAISIDIYQFKEADQAGVAKLDKSLKEYDPLNFKSWFEIENPKINLGEKIKIAAKEKKEIKVSINPPQETEDGDYYFTLVFRTEVDDNTVLPNTKAAISQAEIGSNIILTITKDGKVNPRPEILAFKAPKFIDSFDQISYHIEIANKGTSFFKTVGKIVVTSILGERYVLNLAPQNIIAGSSRIINCIKDEQIVPCQVPTKIFLGNYKATLILDLENQKKYEKSTNTFGAPFVVSCILTIIVAISLLLSYKIKANKK